MSARVTVQDKGAEALLKRLKSKASVRIGILSDEAKSTTGSGTAMTLLEVAAIHEFGAPAAGIPMRSFLRATIDEKEGEIQSVLQALAKQIVVDGLNPNTAMERAGAYGQGLVQARIAEGIAPPNAPATIERKGSSTPLIATGQLRSAITYLVEKP